MKITWLGHSCFKIEEKDYTVVMDPYEDGAVPGLLPVRESANLVLCSHEHGDHNGRSSVKVIQSEADPFVVTKIETYHDEEKGTKRGRNTIHILDDGRCKIAHLGDLGCELEEQQLELLMDLDVIMIPVGGYYTIDARQAAKLVRLLKPRVVLPMHYRSEEGRFGYDVIGPVSEFTEDQDSVMTIPGSEIETGDELSAQIVIMRPANMSFGA